MSDAAPVGQGPGAPVGHAPAANADRATEADEAAEADGAQAPPGASKYYGAPRRYRTSAATTTTTAAAARTATTSPAAATTATATPTTATSAAFPVPTPTSVPTTAKYTVLTMAVCTGLGSRAPGGSRAVLSGSRLHDAECGHEQQRREKCKGFERGLCIGHVPASGRPHRPYHPQCGRPREHGTRPVQRLRGGGDLIILSPF